MKGRLEGLNVSQIEMFDKLPFLCKEMSVGILAGKTWRQAYNDCPSAAFSNDPGAANEIRTCRNHPLMNKFMNAVRNQAELDKRILSKNEALVILTRQARGNVVDNIHFKAKFHGMCPDGGGPLWETVFGLKHASELDPELLANITELSHTKEGIKIKHASAKEAIAEIAKIQGWNKSKTIEFGNPLSVEKRELDKKEYATVREKMIRGDDC